MHMKIQDIEELEYSLSNYPEGPGSEQLLAQTVNVLPFPLLLIDLNHSVVMANWAANDIYGPVHPGIKCYQLLQKQDEPCKGQDCPCMLKRMRKLKRPLALKHPQRGDEGRPALKESHGLPVLDRRGRLTYVALIVFDFMSGDNEQALLHRTQRFLRLAENASDIIYRYQIRPHARFEYVSPASAAILGYTPEEHYSDADLYYKMAHPSEVGRLRDVLLDRFDFKQPLTLRLIHKDGHIVCTEHRITATRDDTGNLLSLEGIARDITERMVFEEKLKHLSLHDTLTGLYNRAFFEEEMCRLNGSDEYPITLVSLDIDGLKQVNDAHGHRKGDGLLKALSQIMKETFRRWDVIARIGGDEFAVILPHTERKMAHFLCERLREKITEYNRSHKDTELNLSLGMATAHDKKVDLEEVFNKADQHMYYFKMSNRRIRISQDIIRILLTALSAKDFVSQGHIERVVRLSLQLGKAIELSEKDLMELEALAQLHDLGKIGVPDGILHKKHALTDAEQKQVKEHATIGYSIARSSPELSHLAELILYHHEWWNGQGYPAGLRGEEIPVVSRIVAIADAFDAMTNDRPYRRAMTTGEALEEIQHCAGQQFDPRLTAEFVKIMSSQ